MNFSTSNKNNNFNLIRLIASIFVLYNHSYILSGFMFEEPLWKKYTSMVTFGNLGVDIFFITSGFLLSISLIENKNPFIFSVNRFFRIFPGLIASLIFTVVVAGIFFTPLGFFDFIKHDQTEHFLIYNSILLKGVVYLLPNVFEGNPVASINGSLWTLPYELKAYIALLCFGFFALVSKKYFSSILKICIFLLCIIIYIKYYNYHYEGRVGVEKYRLYFFFLFGGSVAACIQYIKLDMRWACACCILIFIALTLNKFLFPAYTLLLPYIIITLAYNVSGWVRKFNSIGDYSYGMYIYGFFIQQCIVATIKNITPNALFIYSFFATIVVAFLSWNIVESPVLSFKKLLQNKI